jgi:hypothetical protein
MDPHRFNRFIQRLGAASDTSMERIDRRGDTMDTLRFDSVTRRLSVSASRRQTLAALALAALGRFGLGDEAAAGPGCKDVGATCKEATQCCSGLCKGKKGRKRCKAHDTGGCQAGQASPVCKVGGQYVDCTTSAGKNGFCQTTTGNAAYCVAGGTCMACTEDADCRQVCGPRAACIACAGACAGGTLCAGPDVCQVV